MKSEQLSDRASCNSLGDFSARRRHLLRTATALAGLSILGLPSLGLGQADKIRIGHLTPLTGFLGALGQYATMGLKLAVEEVNASGGVLGVPIEVISEDSVNPSVAASKAQRMLERDGVIALMGEISSASALTISQVAARGRRLFMSTGARSDQLRGKSCNRFMFCVDIPNTVMVNSVGQRLVRDHMVAGKRFFALTADYQFGHDLLRIAKTFLASNQGALIGDELVATDVTDFSPYLIKIRQAEPDVVCSNLAGNQVTTFLKQFAEFGMTYPIAGFNLNTADAWAVGAENFAGTWPTVWHHEIDTASTRKFVAAFRERYGTIPENHAWVEYVSLKILAQVISETNSTDTEALIGYLEKETPFDLLKARKGYFRSWDHQLMQEAYTFTVLPDSKGGSPQNFLDFGDAVPGPEESLEVLATTKDQNTCSM